jgi:hypothetical protein
MVKLVGGVRIHHDTERSKVVRLAHPAKKYTVPYLCSACKESHTQKTYHIYVDSQGDAIVSHEVYASLQQIPDAGFSFLNTVSNPPSQKVTVASPVIRGVF